MAAAKKVLKVDSSSLGANIEGDGEDTGIEVLDAAPVRIRIMLEENDNIPPTGQFFGVDGRGYILRPGEESEVPQGIINILDTAVMSTPVTGDGGTVIGYRDKLRFPYRIIHGARVGA